MLQGAETEVEQPQSLRDVVESVVTEAETAQEKPDRARDEAGRFAATEKAKTEKEAVEPKDKAEVAAPAEPAYVAPKPPSTWKKELSDHWGKLPKEIHEEIARRENDYAKGVSTYKTEYDRVKPIYEAIKPHESYIPQGMKPEQFVSALMQAHRGLTTGTEDDRLNVLAQIIQDNQLPLHKLLIMGEDGKVYQNQSYFRPRQQAQQPAGLTEEKAREIARQEWLVAEQRRQITEFLEAKDDKGNPRYPHFDEVKDTMDGLLRAGLARDLPSAYDAALRHPNHSAIYDAMQKQQRETEDAAKARAAAEAAEKAKRNVVSVRPRTPTGQAAGGARKGLRDVISDAVEEHAR